MKDAALIIFFVLCLGAAVIAGHEHDALADSEDAAAINSRKWVAAQQACPRGYTADWISDKQMRCLREIAHPQLVAGGRP